MIMPIAPIVRGASLLYTYASRGRFYFRLRSTFFIVFSIGWFILQVHAECYGRRDIVSLTLSIFASLIS